jgi:hypothetical protein
MLAMIVSSGVLATLLSLKLRCEDFLKRHEIVPIRRADIGFFEGSERVKVSIYRGIYTYLQACMYILVHTRGHSIYYTLVQSNSYR